MNNICCFSKQGNQNQERGRQQNTVILRRDNNNIGWKKSRQLKVQLLLYVVVLIVILLGSVLNSFVSYDDALTTTIRIDDNDNVNRINPQYQHHLPSKQQTINIQ